MNRKSPEKNAYTDGHTAQLATTPVRIMPRFMGVEVSIIRKEGIRGSMRWVLVVSARRLKFRAQYKRTVSYLDKNGSRRSIPPQ
jgi:hypothetical protein